MSFTIELKSRIAHYLDGSSDWYGLASWLLPRVLDIDECEDPDARQIAYAVQRDLSDLSAGFLNERQFRDNLSAMLAPRATAVTYYPIRMSGFPEQQPNAVLTGTSIVLTPAGFDPKLTRSHQNVAR